MLALVSRMEDDGLLTTRRSAHDRRTTEVFLTPAGVSSRNRHDSLLRDADERLFGEHVRSQDVRALRRIVTGVLDSLERRDTHG